MFNNNIDLDFSDVKYEDVKVEIKSLFTNTFNIEEYIQSFTTSLIFIMQIFLFSSSTNFTQNLFIYAIALISYKIISITTLYFTKRLNELLSQYFVAQKYYEMGDVYKRAVLLTEILGIVLYFPIKFFLQFLFSHYILSKLYIEQTGESLSLYAKDKLNEYLLYNYPTLILSIANTFLCNVLLIFSAKYIININSVLKLVVNVIFCIVYNNKKPESLFVKGISFANITCEVISLVFLICAQRFKSPYPQAWSQFSLQIFTGQSLKAVLSQFEIITFINFLLISLYDELFLVLFTITNVSKERKNSFEEFKFFVALILFKNLFFRFNQKDKEEIINFYNTLCNSDQDAIYNKFSYEYDSISDKNQNFDWIKFIKTKLIGTFVVNVIIGVIYIMFYLFGGFKLIKVTHRNFIAVVFISINSIVEQVSLTVIHILDYLIRRRTIVYILIGFVISIALYVVIILFVGRNFALTILVIYFTFYFVYIKYLPQVKNFDIKVANPEMLMLKNTSIYINEEAL